MTDIPTSAPTEVVEVTSNVMLITYLVVLSLMALSLLSAYGIKKFKDN